MLSGVLSFFFFMYTSQCGLRAASGWNSVILRFVEAGHNTVQIRASNGALRQGTSATRLPSIQLPGKLAPRQGSQATSVHDVSGVHQLQVDAFDTAPTSLYIPLPTSPRPPFLPPLSQQACLDTSCTTRRTWSNKRAAALRRRGISEEGGGRPAGTAPGGQSRRGPASDACGSEAAPRCGGWYGRGVSAFRRGRGGPGWAELGRAALFAHPIPFPRFMIEINCVPSESENGQFFQSGSEGHTESTEVPL